MKDAVQWVRSLIFNLNIYLVMLPIGIAYAPWALMSRRGALAACHAYCRWVRWTARWMIGLRTEVRGTPPTDEVLIAAKHQSFLDIILIFSSIPAGKFIMKKELIWAPLLGQYALRIGCIPVDRGKRGAAVKKMVADVKAGRSAPGQLIIFPRAPASRRGSRRPTRSAPPRSIRTRARTACPSPSMSACSGAGGASCAAPVWLWSSFCRGYPPACPPPIS